MGPRLYDRHMRGAAETELLYDPEDEQTQLDPYPIYRRLRDECPVYRQERLRFWALSRFADVYAALNDHQAFCSRQGLTWDPTAAEQAGVLPMMVTTDPPDHTKLRRLINRGLTPKRVADLEPEVRAGVVEKIDALRATGGGDLVADVAVPVPTAMVGRFLGVPETDRPRFHHWAGAVVAGTSGAAFHQEHHRAVRELYAYFHDLIERRRCEPTDDLIGTLIAAEIDGGQLTTREILGFCFNIVVGGIETTTNLISNGMALLAAHPESARRLAFEPRLIPQAIEEFLRLETPVAGLCRTTTRSVTRHGVTIPAGEKVLLMFGAANRDEREFADPDRLDLDRSSERHLAFGHGAHYCIGAALARLMGRVAFEELTTRLGDSHVDVARGRRQRAAVSRGWESLPIAVRSAA
jgi:cytochrome P450 family 130